MSKPRQQRSGFSNAPKRQPRRKKPAQSSADQSNKERQAVALINQGKLQEAEAIYRELISAGTSNHMVYGSLAALCGMQGRFDEPIRLLRRTLELKPNYPEAHNNLGIALKEQGDLTAAIDSYNKALQLKPNYPEAHYNLAIALKKQGDLTAAIDSYNKALQLKPNHPDAHYNLGNALKEQGNLDAAIASYNKALQLKPNYPEVHNNLGIALHEEGNLDAAIASYNKALQLKPNYPDAHYNSALAMLLSGDYKSGWESHEWRLKNAKGSKKLDASPKCNQWSGEVALKETNKLLLVGEQGLGDTLQFMRYAIALKNEGTSVAFCAKKKLHSLIQSSGIDPSPLTPEQANKVIEGEWMPLLSAAKHLQVSPSNPIITEPYIQPKDELKMKWTDIFGAKEKPVIGINWRGNRKDANKQDRNIPIQVFRKIVERNKGNLVCLQRGALPSEFEQITFNSNMTPHQLDILRIADSDEPEDFLEYAAIINSCDLVITTASTVAHLAAGIGIPTWVLLPKIPDWRWGLEGDTTFWYPSMRLFRQKEKGNWSEVMERVAEALQEQFGSSTMPADPAPIPHTAIKPKPIQDILAPISLGELIDKITILQIKTQHLQGTALANVNRELEALESSLNKLHINIDPTLIQRLKEINQDLWQIEDDIREQERKKNFGKTFIYLARSVYQKNDHRAATKKEINTSYGSALVEEKSYQQY